MFYMSTSLFSSVSVVVSSRSGEGQRTQVLLVSAGWQLHAGEYRLVHCVSGTRGAIRGSASTKLLINCTGLIELIDFMEMVKKKKAQQNWVPVSCLQAEHRTMAVFILAVIVNNYNTGQVRL